MTEDTPSISAQIARDIRLGVFPKKSEQTLQEEAVAETNAAVDHDTGLVTTFSDPVPDREAIARIINIGIINENSGGEIADTILRSLPSREAREKEITRLATIEECARVCELHAKGNEDQTGVASEIGFPSRGLRARASALRIAAAAIRSLTAQPRSNVEGGDVS